MHDVLDSDKSGHELNQLRFDLLKELAEGLVDDSVFPTGFDVTVQLRKVLQDPLYTIDQIARLVSTDPVVSLQLINLANSAAHRRGDLVKSVKDAVNRIGVDSVRAIAMSIAMKQLLRSKEMAIYRSITQSLWEHSLHTACACQVIGKRLTRFNPDEAMLAGLVHDIGVFYLLYRFSSHEELRNRPVSAKFLAAHWHEAIGHQLLIAIRMPEEVAEACFDHDSNRPIPSRPSSLSDVVYVGNLISGGISAWLGSNEETAVSDRLVTEAREIYADLLAEIDAYQNELAGMLEHA